MCKLEMLVHPDIENNFAKDEEVGKRTGCPLGMVLSVLLN